ncbi:MAG: pyridoxamine 5'-phosphate oxidase family protein [Clostridiales bacterium]|nr:pyridoxamine 5'-phosphate oxidase family protein [Clostridiales bacterium]
MDQRELIGKLAEALDDANAGILSTLDENGIVHLRWLTPVLMRGRKGLVYSLSSLDSKKVEHIRSNPNVTWIIQTRAVDQVITLYGKVNILENPSIKTEVLETVGNKLTMFWKINGHLRDFVVMETVIEKAEYYLPMKGLSQTVDFNQ